MRSVPVRQGELFGGDDLAAGLGERPAPLPPPLLRHQLLAWQERLGAHQAPLFGAGAATGGPAGAGGVRGDRGAGRSGRHNHQHTGGHHAADAPNQAGDNGGEDGRSNDAWSAGSAGMGTDGRAGASAGANATAQGNLFASPPAEDPERWAAALDPLALQPQSLSFWRWPEAPQRGAAIYLVLDRAAVGDGALLLYVGETGCADRRWKGAHDCKRYLAAYGEALRRADLPIALSIRFWCDVPEAVRPRRRLEQALIRRWLPPFNKETRERWATPFTADPE